MTLKELSELTGIPYRTIISWKVNKNDNWRPKLIKFLRKQSAEQLKESFKSKFL